MLEQPYVQQNLHHWANLVFGVGKQMMVSPFSSTYNIPQILADRIEGRAL